MTLRVSGAFLLSEIKELHGEVKARGSESKETRNKIDRIINILGCLRHVSDELCAELYNRGQDRTGQWDFIGVTKTQLKAILTSTPTLIPIVDTIPLIPKKNSYHK